MGKTRKTNSKRKIKTALFELLKTHRYQDITVAQITQRAHVNRGTFYLNYLNKDDLANSMHRQFFADITAIINNDTAPQQRFLSTTAIINIAEYMQRWRPLSNLFVNQMNNIDLVEIMQDNIKSKFTHGQTITTSNSKLEKAVFYGIGGIFSLWVKRGMIESIPELVEIIQHYNKY